MLVTSREASRRRGGHATLRLLVILLLLAALFVPIFAGDGFAGALAALCVVAAGLLGNPFVAFGCRLVWRCIGRGLSRGIGTLSTCLDLCVGVLGALFTLPSFVSFL